jgi:hypothetical protein
MVPSTCIGRRVAQDPPSWKAEARVRVKDLTCDLPGSKREVIDQVRAQRGAPVGAFDHDEPRPPAIATQGRHGQVAARLERGTRELREVQESWNTALPRIEERGKLQFATREVSEQVDHHVAAGSDRVELVEPGQDGPVTPDRPE